MSFINAGNEAVRAAYKARAAAERNKPKYDKFGKQAIVDQTKQDLLSMGIRGRAQQSALDIKADEKIREINQEAKDYAKEKVRGARMAGKLAGGAALLGGAYFMSKEKQDEPNERIDILQGYINKNNELSRKEQEESNRQSTESFTKTVSEQDASTEKSTGSLPTPKEKLTGSFPTAKEPLTGSFPTAKEPLTGSFPTAKEPLTGSFPTAKEPLTGSFPTAKEPLTGGWQKLSRVIRFGEGTMGDLGYNTQFTGTKFTDTSKHPRQIRSGGGYTSDAAGAYQFLSTTWDEARNALQLKDFSPESQEKAGRWLTQRRGVNPDQVFKTKEEFRVAMDKLAPEWASLPYSGVSPTGHGRGSSYYGQGGKSLDQLWDLYQRN